MGLPIKGLFAAALLLSLTSGSYGKFIHFTPKFGSGYFHITAAAGEEFDPYLFLAVRTRQMRNACGADDRIERCHCLYKVLRRTTRIQTISYSSTCPPVNADLNRKSQLL